MLPAEVEAPGPIRVSYRRGFGIAPVLVGTIGVEATVGWKEVEVVLSARDLRLRGIVSGECLASPGD